MKEGIQMDNKKIIEKGSRIVTEQGVFYLIQSGVDNGYGFLDHPAIKEEDKMSLGEPIATPKREFLDSDYNKYLGDKDSKGLEEKLLECKSKGIETFVGKGAPFKVTEAVGHWSVTPNKDIDSEEGYWAVPTEEDLKHYEDLGIKKPAKKL